MGMIRRIGDNMNIWQRMLIIISTLIIMVMIILDLEGIRDINGLIMGLLLGLIIGQLLQVIRGSRHKNE